MKKKKKVNASGFRRENGFRVNLEWVQSGFIEGLKQGLTGFRVGLE